MAFIWKKVTDKEYIESKGFTYIDGKSISDARWCAIDKEKYFGF